MSMFSRSTLRPGPFACALVLGALALQPLGGADAATQVVTNCNDAGTGSLRRAVAVAASRDTIDLRGLSCRVIRLGGQIEIPQDDLELIGPGRDVLSINARQASRVFEHVGTGTLRIRRLSIAYGRNDSMPFPYAVVGGCIRSAGTVELLGSQIHHCSVEGEGGLEGGSAGGAVSAQRIVASYSRVFANRAVDSNGGGGGLSANEVILVRSQVYRNGAGQTGGGIYARARAVVQHSSVVENEAGYDGGGMYTNGTVDVRNSSVSRNRVVPVSSTAEGGGLWVRGEGGYSTIVNSTISGNVALDYAAARFGGDVAIFNSTITANHGNVGFDRGPSGCAGNGAVHGDGAVELESTILAGNTCDGWPPPVDLGGGLVSGSHNLIGLSAVAVPDDTVSADPRLAPLAYNGGPTLSHRPLGDSPAIGRGSNPLELRYDQRGAGFPRVRMGQPDIGAIER